jgi:hypothetical protein
MLLTYFGAIDVVVSGELLPCHCCVVAVVAVAVVGERGVVTRVPTRRVLEKAIPPLNPFCPLSSGFCSSDVVIVSSGCVSPSTLSPISMRFAPDQSHRRDAADQRGGGAGRAAAAGRGHAQRK